MIKPVVHYEGIPRFSIWPWFTEKDGSSITIGVIPFVVDHPKLGRCYDVITSKIVVPIDPEGHFETLNTIYEPHQNS